MDLVQLMELSVLGTALSLLVQWIKTKYGTDSTGSKMLVLGLAVVCGTGYYFLEGTQALVAIVAILGISQTFYAFFLK